MTYNKENRTRKQSDIRIKESDGWSRQSESTIGSKNPKDKNIIPASSNLLSIVKKLCTLKSYDANSQSLQYRASKSQIYLLLQQLSQQQKQAASRR